MLCKLKAYDNLQVLDSKLTFLALYKIFRLK